MRDLLRQLVEEKPDLRIDILEWDASILFRPGQVVPDLVETPIDAHPRINLARDGNVPGRRLAS